MPLPNVTLVAFHGVEKRPSLMRLLENLLRTVERFSKKHGLTFHPYDLCQMHATLIGTEAYPKPIPGIPPIPIECIVRTNESTWELYNFETEESKVDQPN